MDVALYAEDARIKENFYHAFNRALQKRKHIPELSGCATPAHCSPALACPHRLHDRTWKASRTWARWDSAAHPLRPPPRAGHSAVSSTCSEPHMQ
jgi:hypothetical protein